MESWFGLKSSHPSLDALQTILKHFFILLNGFPCTKGTACLVCTAVLCYLPCRGAEEAQECRARAGTCAGKQRGMGGSRGCVPGRGCERAPRVGGPAPACPGQHHAVPPAPRGCSARPGNSMSCLLGVTAAEPQPYPGVCCWWREQSLVLTRLGTDCTWLCFPASVKRRAEPPVSWGPARCWAECWGQKLFWGAPLLATPDRGSRVPPA